MIDIKSLTKEELKQELSDFSLANYRINQIYKWLHLYGVSSFEEMTDLPKKLRSDLSELFSIPGCKIEEKYVSSIDGTVKYLFKLYDGEYIETVLMKYKYGYTICVSSQVGCKMGCTFCASTLAGFKRNLLPSEIESQIHTVQNDMNIKITHVVLMGIGEPLDNYSNVIKSLRTINNSDGLNISFRNITLSTCGIATKIYDLIDENIPITLTLSLHAPNDRIRDKLMPVNNRWGVEEVLKACKTYAKRTSRRVTFEYTLIKDVNDSVQCAYELASKLKGFICHVNLIPVNDVEERGNIRSSQTYITNFRDTLKSLGINATIRRTLGKDINASCGQLRRRKNEGDSSENCC